MDDFLGGGFMDGEEGSEVRRYFEHSRAFCIIVNPQDEDDKSDEGDEDDEDDEDAGSNDDDNQSFASVDDLEGM